MTRLTLALIAAAGLCAAATSASAQYDDPQGAARKAAEQSMAKALADKAANDAIVAKQRAAEKASSDNTVAKPKATPKPPTGATSPQ